MYVREYLGFVASVHSIENKKSKVESVIELTGLTVESKKKIGQLSKGYKQRVGLAAALIHDPEVLILDEPTSGLDPNQILEIRDVIRKQGKDKTILFSSHILHEVEAMCERVIIIHKGQLVADDKLSDLRKANKANSVVIVQFKEVVDPQRLQNMNGVIKVTPVSGNSFKITTADPEFIRKQILELAIGSNLNIVSLQSENQSLEEVFRNLTGSVTG
jgi:ABC-2 type transport system ATP-binding protein